MATFRRDPITGMALPPLKSPGRPKGSVNKVSKTMKEAFKEAFEQLGGVPKLVEWAERNPDKFYTLVARLLPVDITSNEQAITPTIVKVNLVAPQVVQKEAPEQIEAVVCPAVEEETSVAAKLLDPEYEVLSLPSTTD